MSQAIPPSRSGADTKPERDRDESTPPAVCRARLTPNVGAGRRARGSWPRPPGRHRLSARQRKRREKAKAEPHLRALRRPSTLLGGCSFSTLMQPFICGRKGRLMVGPALTRLGVSQRLVLTSILEDFAKAPTGCT